MGRPPNTVTDDSLVTWCNPSPDVGRPGKGAGRRRRADGAVRRRGVRFRRSGQRQGCADSFQQRDRGDDAAGFRRERAGWVISRGRRVRPGTVPGPGGVPGLLADQERPAGLGVPFAVLVAVTAPGGQVLVRGVWWGHVSSPPGRTPGGPAVFGFADLLGVQRAGYLGSLGAAGLGEHR